MQNWKNTIDLLTAAQTRLKRVKKHLQGTEMEKLTLGIEIAISNLEDYKKVLKDGDKDD